MLIFHFEVNNIERKLTMAKLAESLTFNAGLLRETVPIGKPKAPSLNAKVFEKIILQLYKAIIHRRGIFSLVSMETHAPQLIFYPGSPHINKALPITDKSLQVSFWQVPHVEPVKILEKVGQTNSCDELTRSYPAVLLPHTLEHRRWLWFTTLTDRREKSDRVYPAHCDIYNDHPEFYNDGVYYMNSVQFRQVIKSGKYKVGSPDQSAGNWQICAFTLFTKFGGDPINLLKHAGWSVEKVYTWKNKEKKRLGYDPIPGWGRKLISLYFLYLAGLGYTLPEDAFASDVHAQAIPIQVGVLDYGDRDIVYSSLFAEMIRKAVTALCKDKGYDIILVAHASWLLGSQLCTNCSGNDAAPVLCPIYKECHGRVDTSWYFSKGRWPKEIQIMTKGGERPVFGVPTDFTERVRSTKKGLSKRSMMPTLQLFPK